MARLRTIESIYNGSTLFRIPDYQRGYAWQKKQREDLWQDILNILPNMKRKHYTGSIKVNKVSKEYAQNKWKDDINFINSSGDDALLHVIDGQQRLTSIVILIWVILNNVEKDVDVFNNSSINSLKHKYIHSEVIDNNEPTYYFGYEDDDPSYEHLKQIIFEQAGDKKKLFKTAYTNNLDEAKKFFKNKIRELDIKYETKSISVKEDIFRIITQNLRFDLMDLSDEDLDINTVFETENNRGKPLTNLELLKNRLIFLTTLFTSQNNKEEEKFKIIREELRATIKGTWQTIYLFLGLNIENKLDDDDFLKAHWTMYCRYERSGKDPYARDIFDEVFNIKKVLNKEINYKEIEDYSKSLKQTVVEWYIINNPYHAYEKINENIENKEEFDKKITSLISIEKEEAFELNKLKRIGFRKFTPILLTARVKGVSEKDNSINTEKRIKLIKIIERYNFLLFPISHRKANLGEFNFQRLTHQLYKPQNKEKLIGSKSGTLMSFDYLIEEIEINWIQEYFNINIFKDKIEELYLATDKKAKTAINHKKGYIIWYGLEYLLQEYELFLKIPEKEKKPKFNKRIERVYTEDKFEYIYKRNPSYSLGNLFLSNRKFPANLSVEKRKEKMLTDTGSSLQENLFANDYNFDNSIETIENRGLNLLSFIEKRWNVTISEEQKKSLLFLKHITDN